MTDQPPRPLRAVATDRGLGPPAAYAQLLERIVAAGDSAQTVGAAARMTLDEVCAFTGWPVGHLVICGSEMAPASTDVWHLDAPFASTGLEEAAATGHAAPVPELARRVVTLGRPHWIADVRAHPELAGTDSAAAALRAAFGLPVRVDDEVVAVLEFFTSVPIEPDPTLLEMLAAVSTQLARVVERERAGRELQESQRRVEVLTRSYERQLADRALRDHLTGLPNRGLLLDRLELALARTGRERSSVAVLVLDLDRFKAVNDSLGHQTGDDLLRAVAGRLTGLVRPGDTVARVSSDEFAVLIEDVGDQDEAVRLTAHVLTAFDRDFELPTGRLTVSASAGLTAAPGGTADPALLLGEAEDALRRSRQQGPGNTEIFDAHMRTEAARRISTEHDLRDAIGGDQFQLEYQPIVTLGTGAVYGAEALVRWNHPVRGLLQPTDFVPVAEETGLIVPLGRWVLAEACRQAVGWKHSANGTGFILSVNVSTHQFQPPDWTDEVAEVLRAAGLAPDQLIIEITETALMENTELAGLRLEELRRVGIRLAIDDFGTGYSSLNYLRHLPVDILKIDKSFIEGITQGPHESALARAILKLARTLKLQAVAEGVERQEQLVMLQRLGCQLGQGFHLGRPQPAEGISELLSP